MLSIAQFLYIKTDKMFSCIKMKRLIKTMRAFERMI